MYVWMMEHVGGKYKTILGAAPHYNFGFWGLMTAVFAYCLPHWRHLQAREAIRHWRFRELPFGGLTCCEKL